MIVEQKICYMFNKFFSAFVKELKNLDETLKTTIKKHYKVIDKSSEEYYQFFWNNVKDHIRVFIDDEDLTNNETIKDIEIIQGISIKNAADVLKDNNLQTFWNYVNILIIFAYLYTEIKQTSTEQTNVDGEENNDNVENTEQTDENKNSEEDSNEQPETKHTPSVGVYLLFVKVVKILSMIQNSQDPAAELVDIIDDDIKSLVSKIKVFDVVNDDIKIDDAADTMPIPPKDFLESIENSKIANIAKEISKEIDISNINIEKPEDVAKLMDFSGSNNFLGNIVSKVSTKLTEKISSGEINQDDLLSEAMSMMGMLNGGGAGGAGGIADILKNMGGLGGMLNNPMMNEMMKMAKKGKVATKNTGGSRRSSVSTRDRLRKKLEEKNKKSSQGDNQQ